MGWDEMILPNAFYEKLTTAWQALCDQITAIPRRHSLPAPTGKHVGTKTAQHRERLPARVKAHGESQTSGKAGCSSPGSPFWWQWRFR